MYNRKKRPNNFGKKRNAYSSGKDRFSQKSESFKANCAECQSDCHVPFKPNGRKPVLCSNCFRRQEGGGKGRFDRSDRFSPRRSFDGPRVKRRSPDSGMQDELKQIRQKLDQVLELLRG